MSNANPPDWGEEHDGASHGLALAPIQAKVAPPPKYKVVLLNDDFTPMEFVVRVLQRFFGHNQEKAVQIMLAIHQKGKGLAGIYPFEIAETKVSQVNMFARDHQHPLLTILEPE